MLNSIAGFKKNTKNLNDMYDQLSEYIFRLTEKEKNKGIEDYLETLHLVIKNYLTGKVSYSSFIHYINRQFGIEIDKVEKALSYIGKEKYEKTSKGNSTLPKVSIIIPTYNRKGYLEQSINSILMQDYPNIEIIVMDDGSTDGTNEMMKKKFVQDPSITYKRRKYNEGPSKNRKEAFELYAEGEYVIFLDDDDYLIDNDYLYKAVNFHINNPNVSFVAANVFFYNMKSNKWNLSNLNFDKIIDKHEYFLNFQKEEYPKPIPSITVFKRSSLIEMEIGNMKSVNDVSIFLRALLAGDAGFIDTIAGVYRVHGNNITFNLTPDFIIDNLDEKLVIKNIAINKYGYSIKEMEEWMDYMSFNTMFYFITNSARNLTDIKEMYLWATKNTPNIVNRIGFKRLIEKWIRIDSETQGIFRMSYDLIETILEGLSYVINLSEDQAEKVILMLNDVSIGFVSIKEAIVPIVERIDEYTLHNRIGLLQQTLERILNDNNIENIIEITQSTLEPLFNELRNEIKFYLLITIE